MISNEYGLLVLRADASKVMGTGHIMRCLSLAHNWKARGGDVAFVSSCESSEIAERIYDSGFKFLSLEYKYPHPQDLQATLSLLAEYCRSYKKINWIVLDGYHFDLLYQRALKDSGYGLMIIDDCNHLDSYDCDVLLNYNVYAEGLKYHLNMDAKSLLGLKYAPIRPEFRFFVGRKRFINNYPNKILVALGGADHDNVTLKVLKAISFIRYPGLDVKAIIGPANPHFSEIHNYLSSLDIKAEALFSIRNMHEYMDWADIAITSGGVTCQEIACAGLPCIIIVLSKNQEEVAKTYHADKMAINLGWYNKLRIKDIAFAVDSLLKSRSERENLSKKCLSRVDCFGPNRIVNDLLPSEIQLRDINEEDMEIIRIWANEPYTREMSFSPEYISKDTHKKWFYNKLKDSESYFYMAENQNRIPAGQIRFERINGEMRISISISPDFRGCGLGSKVISNAVFKFFKESDYDKVVALIKTQHKPSIRSFVKAGFYLITEDSYKGIPILKMGYERNSGYDR